MTADPDGPLVAMAFKIVDEQFTTDKTNEDLQTVREDIAADLDDIYETVFRRALQSQLLQDLIADRQLPFIGPARVLADHPDKLVNKIDEAHMQLAKNLGEVVRRAETEVVFISPYYVPGERGVQLVRDLVAKGVRVVIVTNSLASNNHVPVHSAYARYRKDVVNAGAELYEARANAARELEGDDSGPEVLTLHTKAILIDRRYLFVGSLNLDPRSTQINAEMGLLIDSEPMVKVLLESGEQSLETMTYRLRVNDRGKLEWHTRIDGQEVIETKEPLTSGWLRFKAWFMKIAPESQL